MNLDIKIFLLCPIPEDQKPINEYINFKENNLTNWTIFSQKKYINTLFRTYLFFFLCFSFFSSPELFIIFKKIDLHSFFFKQALFDWFFIKFFLSFLSLFFYLTFILFRWVGINKRFKNPRLIYEEASWYDGQIWEKPFFLIKNDKLLSTQKIEPVLQRLVRTNLVCFLFLVGFFFFFEIF